MVKEGMFSKSKPEGLIKVIRHGPSRALPRVRSKRVVWWLAVNRSCRAIQHLVEHSFDGEARLRSSEVSLDQCCSTRFHTHLLEQRIVAFARLGGPLHGRVQDR